MTTQNAATQYGIILHTLRDMDGHYCATERVTDFVSGTLEAAQTEAKMRNAGHCTRDRCINTTCPNGFKVHNGYYSVNHNPPQREKRR